MAKAPNHDELLAAAVQAQRKFEATVDEARVERRKVFQDALRSTVTGRDIANATGLSESTVSAIKAGRY